MVDVAGFKAMYPVPVLDPQNVSWADRNPTPDNNLFVAVTEVFCVNGDDLLACYGHATSWLLLLHGLLAFSGTPPACIC